MGSPWDDLAVRPVPGHDGRFTTVLSEPWQLAVVPQGGIVAGIAIKAMEAVLDEPAQALRTMTAMFAAPVAVGPVEIDVTLLRRGQTMSQLTATVRNVGACAGLTAIAAFGAQRRGFEFTELAPPDVPGPEGVRSFRDPLPEGVDFEFDGDPFPFWDQILESRPVIGRPPWEPYVESPAEVAYWYRFDDPPLTPSGHLDVAGLVVMCDSMPGSVGQKIRAEDDQRWFAPSVDLTVHVLGQAAPGFLLAHMNARHAGDGYASIDAALWDPSGDEPRLVAYATQLCLFAFNAR